MVSAAGLCCLAGPPPHSVGWVELSLFVVGCCLGVDRPRIARGRYIIKSGGGFRDYLFLHFPVTAAIISEKMRIQIQETGHEKVAHRDSDL